MAVQPWDGKDTRTAPPTCARKSFLNLNMGPLLYALEFMLHALEFRLRDATGPAGGYQGNFGHPTSVIVDFPFITG